MVVEGAGAGNQIKATDVVIGKNLLERKVGVGVSGFVDDFKFKKLSSLIDDNNLIA